MIVTLDVFSGRPNPTWDLSDQETKQLVDRFAKRALAAEDATNGSLGFRGFVLHPAQDDAPAGAGIAGSFRVGGAAPEGYVAAGSEKALNLDESEEAVKWLLATGRHVLEDSITEAVTASTKAMRAAKAALPDPSPDPFDAKAIAAPCSIRNTPYNPGFWNVPAVQPNNNCYNYSMNHRSDTFAQPGRISGHMYTAFTCASVGNGADWDGCKTTCSGSAKLVALVIWPGNDYHWYRRHSEGFWGHKPGRTAARNTDNSNRVINGTTLTPANCNRGPYTVFCGYRFSPTGMKVR